MSSHLQFKDNDSFLAVTTRAGDITKVDLYHKETGIHARGNSKRYHMDTYDYYLGKDIAYFRALSRLGEKLLNRTIKDLSKERA